MKIYHFLCYYPRGAAFSRQRRELKFSDTWPYLSPPPPFSANVRTHYNRYTGGRVASVVVKRNNYFNILRNIISFLLSLHTICRKTATNPTNLPTIGHTEIKTIFNTECFYHTSVSKILFSRPQTKKKKYMIKIKRTNILSLFCTGLTLSLTN
jgi:hypothetical protein